MDTLHQNIVTCHGCEHLERPVNNCKFGRCSCKADPQKTHFIELATSGKCPLNKFSEAAPAPTNLPNDVSRPMPTTADPWQEAGPRLWGELHEWALVGDINDTLAWLAKFTERIWCQSCAAHWRQWVAANPPRIKSRESLFSWSVDGHNAVNARLGKPQMTVEAARTKWIQ